MPSGLTSSIYEGKPTTLRQFILRCARHMGILARFKEESADWEIPKSIKPDSPYYSEQLSKDKRELAELEKLSEREIKSAAKKDYEEKRAQAEKFNEDRAGMRSRYEDMLDQVKAWEIPKELEGLKQLAIEQLVDSTNFDCSPFDIPVEPFDAQKWYENNASSLRRDIDCYMKEIENEKKRTVKINAWLKVLHENLEE